MQFEIKALTPFGIEINSNRPIAETFKSDNLIDLSTQFQLIVFRKSMIEDKASMLHFAKSLGPLLEWDSGPVIEMRVQEETKNYLFTNGPVPFHWDGAFHSRTPRFLLFHCLEAPLKDCGGETIFTNTHKLYEETTTEDLHAWRAINITYETKKIMHYGGKITQALIQEHPTTGKKLIRFAEPVPEEMLNPVTVNVEKLNAKQAQQLIKVIADKCYNKEYCYTHNWQKDDFIIADNFALLHGRHAFRQFSPRHLRRIQIL